MRNAPKQTTPKLRPRTILRQVKRGALPVKRLEAESPTMGAVLSVDFSSSPGLPTRLRQAQDPQQGSIKTNITYNTLLLQPLRLNPSYIRLDLEFQPKNNLPPIKLCLLLTLPTDLAALSALLRHQRLTLVEHDPTIALATLLRGLAGQVVLNKPICVATIPATQELVNILNAYSPGQGLMLE